MIYQNFPFSYYRILCKKTKSNQLLPAAKRTGMVFLLGILAFQLSAQTAKPADSISKPPIAIISIKPVASVYEMAVNPLELLQGKIAGLWISANSGMPGSDFTITNRGKSSFTTSNNPLVVVDGVPQSDIPLTLNPQDIESISLVNYGPESTKYNMDAGNGILIIKTLAGDKKLHVNYSGKLGFSSLPRDVSVFSSSEYRNLVNEKFGENAGITSLMGSASTDWQKEIYRSSFSQDHHLSISGSLGSIPVRLAVGKTIQNGILNTSKYNRNSVILSVTPSFFDKHLDINFNMNGAFMKNDIANEQAIMNAIFFDPTQVVSNGSKYGGYFTWENANFPTAFMPANPVALLALTLHTSDINNLNTCLKADYKFHFLPELQLGAMYSQQSYKNNNVVQTDTSASWLYIPGAGNIDKTILKTNNKYFDIHSAYSHVTDASGGKIEISAGYTWQKGTVSTDFTNSTVTAPDNIRTSTYISNEKSLISMYGDVNYNLKDKYFLTASIQHGGSSMFADENKWSNYPSFSIAWKLKKESFVADNRVISNLVIRALYSITGTMMNNITSSYTGIDAGLTPEKIKNFVAGIDYGLFNRVNGSIEFYSKNGDNMFVAIPISSGTSFSSVLLSNGCSTRNTGVTFSLRTRVMESKSMSWDLNANFSVNNNEILSMPDGNIQFMIPAGPIDGGLGYTIQMQAAGHPINSFFVKQQVYFSNGLPIEGVYVDLNNPYGPPGSELSKRYFSKSSDPMFTAGISSSFSYLNWEFTFSGRLSMGNYNYNNLNSLSVYNAIPGFTNAYLKNILTSVSGTQFNNYQLYSDYYIDNASFFRMDVIGLGYRFEHIAHSDVNLLLSAGVQNAFVITAYSGQDPEIVSGIDQGIYPKARTVTTGVTLNF